MSDLSYFALGAKVSTQVFFLGSESNLFVHLTVANVIPSVFRARGALVHNSSEKSYTKPSPNITEVLKYSYFWHA